MELKLERISGRLYKALIEQNSLQLRNKRIQMEISRLRNIAGREPAGDTEVDVIECTISRFDISLLTIISSDNIPTHMDLRKLLEAIS